MCVYLSLSSVRDYTAFLSFDIPVHWSPVPRSQASEQQSSRNSYLFEGFFFFFYVEYEYTDIGDVYKSVGSVCDPYSNSPNEKR